MNSSTVISKELAHQESHCTKIDKWGAFASAICAVHCLLTSIALGALSIVGLGFLGSTTTDIVFVLIAMSLGAFAVRNGYKHHRSWVPAIMFAAGLLMVFLSHFVLKHTHAPHSHEEHSSLGEIAPDILAVGGGITLMSFHIVNARLQRRARRKLSCCCK
jgi:hypothetical protein